ncbi:dephospho-CoA kinase [Breoghania corrubedonensis]|uniref:Dephospho-CoA kinase n=1 Tax=Breoghania corrubedonensis TaxID=665038 RepID=A0A2T5VHL8_9HYPH|nr:dephospho-CoA kinase [Breoghania corrubedonensis]PTW63257.1 dephospho-CoA kinase [Breoghania corrubedonensis]
MIVLGLTGSIGMGKSTTGRLFAEAGIPVYDADTTVHALYAGKAAPAIERAFPGTVVNRVVDRAALGEYVVGKPAALARLEAIIHPLVREVRDHFLADARARLCPVAVLDIPLLFETGGEEHVDAVVLVTTSAEIQRERVLARPEMTLEKFDAILARQMPDGEKRRRSHFMIETGHGLEPARRRVAAILRATAAMGG